MGPESSEQLRVQKDGFAAPTAALCDCGNLKCSHSGDHVVDIVVVVLVGHELAIDFFLVPSLWDLVVEYNRVWHVLSEPRGQLCGVASILGFIVACAPAVGPTIEAVLNHKDGDFKVQPNRHGYFINI